MTDSVDTTWSPVDEETEASPFAIGTLVLLVIAAVALAVTIVLLLLRCRGESDDLLEIGGIVVDHIAASAASGVAQ